MATRVVLIPGDGIGPEVSGATVQVLEVAKAAVEWEEVQAKPIVGHRKEDTDADPVVIAVNPVQVALKGPLTTPIGSGHRSINVALRKALELYANFRPVKNLPGIRTPFPDVDLVIV
jgi:isocitrate dehydrogenase (NAD+)